MSSSVMFTEEETNEIKEAFVLFDIANKKRLGVDKVLRLLRSLGQNLTYNDVIYPAPSYSFSSKSCSESCLSKRKTILTLTSSSLFLPSLVSTNTGPRICARLLWLWTRASRARFH
jgi:hypothetical protein